MIHTFVYFLSFFFLLQSVHSLTPRNHFFSKISKYSEKKFFKKRSQRPPLRLRLNNNTTEKEIKNTSLAKSPEKINKSSIQKNWEKVKNQNKRDFFLDPSFPLSPDISPSVSPLFDPEMVNKKKLVIYIKNKISLLKSSSDKKLLLKCFEQLFSEVKQLKLFNFNTFKNYQKFKKKIQYIEKFEECFEKDKWDWSEILQKLKLQGMVIYLFLSQTFETISETLPITFSVESETKEDQLMNLSHFIKLKLKQYKKSGVLEEFLNKILKELEIILDSQDFSQIETIKKKLECIQELEKEIKENSLNWFKKLNMLNGKNLICIFCAITERQNLNKSTAKNFNKIEMESLSIHSLTKTEWLISSNIDCLKEALEYILKNTFQEKGLTSSFQEKSKKSPILLKTLNHFKKLKILCDDTFTETEMNWLKDASILFSSLDKFKSEFSTFQSQLIEENKKILTSLFIISTLVDEIDDCYTRFSYSVDEESYERLNELINLAKSMIVEYLPTEDLKEKFFNLDKIAFLQSLNKYS